MNNAFARIGRTCVSMALAGGLSALAMFGAAANSVTITLPHSVAVGSTTLPSGNYTITSMELAGGNQYFILRAENGAAAATLQAQRVTGEVPDVTSVEFSTAGPNWQFRKLFIQGASTSYEFAVTEPTEK